MRNRTRPNPKWRTEVRRLVRLRDNGWCRYCGAGGSQLDHVVPKCNKGSELAFENLVWCCKRCNDIKGREMGFEMRGGQLFWHGRLVAREGIFGRGLLNEVLEQRQQGRQLAQGLQHLVQFSRYRGGAL